MTPLLACPHCSSPRAKVFARPLASKGVRSGRWMLVIGTACEHLSLREGWNIGDDPEPLIKIWNDRATAGAAEVSERRGHTAEQAEDFLCSLSESYRVRGFAS